MGLVSFTDSLYFQTGDDLLDPATFLHLFALLYPL